VLDIEEHAELIKHYYDQTFCFIADIYFCFYSARDRSKVSLLISAEHAHTGNRKQTGNVIFEIRPKIRMLFVRFKNKTSRLQRDFEQ